MITERRVDLADLQLLFLYLEMLATIGAYLQTGRLPIRFPIYIGIIALARYLVIDLQGHGDLENARGGRHHAASGNDGTRPALRAPQAAVPGKRRRPQTHRQGRLTPERQKTGMVPTILFK
ncbi:MAG TPA: phosphate-starvation-inducible PsiE family protein [Guyparkeria sp.]|nr:phosphate-starvation-inducible PsiE family protein [Guyparkeria sp.]